MDTPVPPSLTRSLAVGIAVSGMLQLSTALETPPDKGGGTFLAELRAGSVLVLTPQAFHAASAVSRKFGTHLSAEWIAL